MLDRRCWVLLAALVAGCGFWSKEGTTEETGVQDTVQLRLPPVGTLPPGVGAEVGDQGREVYERSCVMCHGEQGEGTALGPSLTDAAWLRGRTGTFEEIVGVVRDGVESDSAGYPVPMNPRGDGTLTDDEVRAVAAYAYSIAHRG
jgi:mono/diheme cytochrome c family protein